jgi:hypothetical protein
MNTIHCRVKQNEYQDIGKRHVTPAEALVLRAIHDPAAHAEASSAAPEDQARFWKVIVNPVASGEAETVVHDEETGKEVSRRARTNGEELIRLRRHYPTKSRNNPKIHIVDEMFPGLTPKLPETFQEIGLQVDAPHRTPARAHGSELATRTDDERVVKYEAAPKTPKAPMAPKAPKAPKGDKPGEPPAGE